MAVSDVVVVNDNPSTVVVTETDNSYVVEALAGVQGEPGYAATVAVGTTTTAQSGTNASVTNSGDSHAAVLDFVIPAGRSGTTKVDTVSTGAPGSSVAITNTGTPSDAVLNFTIPRGDKGDAATIAVGSTTTGAAGTSASVTNSGTSGAAVFNFTIPQGLKGDKGDAATVAVGTVTTGAAGSNASVTNSGNSGAAVFNFTIPRGNTGAAATIAVGTVTTGAAGSSATVTNSGTSGAAVFDFKIPQGAKGDTGATGPANTLTVGTVSSVPNGTTPSVTITGASPNQTINFTLEAGPTGPQGPKGDPGAGSISTINGNAGPDITLDKTWVGLNNVDNTSDANKPISSATQTALNGKEATISAGTTAQYWRGDKTWQALNKAAVGLANVDNTSDANKPVSTAQQTALNGKEATIAAGTTAQYWRGDKTWQTLNAAAVANAVTLDTTQTITGTKTFSAAPAFSVGGQTITLNAGAADHTYMAFFARTATPSTRTGYVGFSAAGVTALTIQNEISGGAITLQPGTSGSVLLNADTSVSGTLSATTLNPTNALAQSKTHASADTDSATTAIHHTLGTGANQAAAGNHNHSGVYEPVITAGTTSQYRRGDKTWQTLDKTAVGLANVDNTSDANKPVSTAQQTALNAKVSRVLYSGSAYPARPTSTYVEWVGPVQPTNANSGDTWVNTA